MDEAVLLLSDEIEEQLEAAVEPWIVAPLNERVTRTV